MPPSQTPSPFFPYPLPLILLLIFSLASSATATPTTLNLTAISATNGSSTLECWHLAAPFAVSTTPGTAGSATLQLGNASNASYTIIPPRFDGGAHRAPVVQYVLYLSGLAHITLPHSAEEAWIRGGEYGMIVAADTAAVSEVGHVTQYPGGGETVAVQVPTKGGEVPAHEVLYEGPCRGREMVL